MAAYYNEIDPYAAQWLRNLIAAGHIAPGDVDERSIEDVHPDDLKPYTQCHFFAGIGVWSYALRLAGWPDDRPVWTGSCPCQPFSQAGEGLGFDDPRHLWPDFAWLIRERKPPVVFGEQVASRIIEPWVDLIQTDLEAMDYAFGGVPFPAAGIGSPNIRDRLYWLANANANANGKRQEPGGNRARPGNPRRKSTVVRLASANGVRLEPAPCAGLQDAEHHTQPRCGSEWLADSECRNTAESEGQRAGPGNPQGAGSPGESEGCSQILDPRTAGALNGFWADADWLFCRDGKWRPVEPGTSPLANGASSRVGRLRAYGNAINAQQAKTFIAAYMQL